MILLPPTSLWLAAAAPPPDPPAVPPELAPFTVSFTGEVKFIIKGAGPTPYTYPPPSRTHRRSWKAGRSR